jgi:hypothetical protein
LYYSVLVGYFIDPYSIQFWLSQAEKISLKDKYCNLFTGNSYDINTIMAS